MSVNNNNKGFTPNDGAADVRKKLTRKLQEKDAQIVDLKNRLEQVTQELVDTNKRVSKNVRF